MNGHTYKQRRSESQSIGMAETIASGDNWTKYFIAISSARGDKF